MKKEDETYSDCCGAADGAVSEDGPSWSDIGFCPTCREHCEFITEENEDETKD